VILAHFSYEYDFDKDSWINLAISFGLRAREDAIVLGRYRDVVASPR
jgi:hypothetical protein